jgi:hypothetical protein
MLPRVAIVRQTHGMLTCLEKTNVGKADFIADEEWYFHGFRYQKRKTYSVLIPSNRNIKETCIA